MSKKNFRNNFTKTYKQPERIHIAKEQQAVFDAVAEDYYKEFSNRLSRSIALLTMGSDFDYFDYKHKLLEVDDGFCILNYSDSPAKQWLKENVPNQYSVIDCKMVIRGMLMQGSQINFKNDDALLLFKLRWSDEIIFEDEVFQF